MQILCGAVWCCRWKRRMSVNWAGYFSRLSCLKWASETFEMTVVYQKTRVGGMGGRMDREGGRGYSGQVWLTELRHITNGYMLDRESHASQSVTADSLYLTSATVCPAKPGPSLTSLCAPTENRPFPASFRGCGVTCFGRILRGADQEVVALKTNSLYGECKGIVCAGIFQHVDDDELADLRWVRRWFHLWTLDMLCVHL